MVRGDSESRSDSDKLERTYNDGVALIQKPFQDHRSVQACELALAEYFGGERQRGGRRYLQSRRYMLRQSIIGDGACDQSGTYRQTRPLDMMKVVYV